MEGINQSITELNLKFNERMAQFEEDLKKAPITSTSTAGLAAEFSSFRLTIVQALNTLQQEVNSIVQIVDNMETRSRRKILLVHGVPEAKDENSSEVVRQFLRDRFNVLISEADIKRCHRMGRTVTHKPRPILFKLHNASIRNEVWSNKTKLKGSGITVSEFLTRTRHKVFMAARDRFGVNQCWTRDGTVFIIDGAGKRHRVSSCADLNRLEQNSGQIEQPAASTKLAPASKLKRAAARK